MESHCLRVGNMIDKVMKTLTCSEARTRFTTQRQATRDEALEEMRLRVHGAIIEAIDRGRDSVVMVWPFSSLGVTAPQHVIEAANVLRGELLRDGYSVDVSSTGSWGLAQASVCVHGWAT